jgi:2-dehydropantoate 2-reductase
VRIAIVGVGGIGGYYAGLMARAGHELRLLARGANLDAIRSRGLEIRTPESTWRATVFATDDARELGEVEAAVVAVKSYSLSDVAAAVRTLAMAGAAVLPLLNGVDAADRIAELGVPRDQLLGGVTYISAVRVRPGVFERRSPFQRVLLGELRGGMSQRANRIAATFREAGVEARALDDIALALWQKFVFIASVSAVCGLARSPIGSLRETALGRRLIERAVREVVMVGRARGVALPADEESRTLTLITSLPPATTPSFLRDVEAGGPTELDILSGAVSRLAASTRVETPIHDTAAVALAPAGESRVSR